MKKDNINIEQWAIWGGAVIFILLAVTLLVVFQVWMLQNGGDGRGTGCCVSGETNVSAPLH